MSLLRDRTDDELRASGCLKWAAAPPDVLPAWVAEMDFAIAEPIRSAVGSAVDVGSFGYAGPSEDTGVPEALASFSERRWGWSIDSANVILTGDVIDGLALVLTTLCDDGPVIVPTPAYPPFLEVVGVAGRELVTIPLDPDAAEATLDLEAIDEAFTAGARTLILCQPHNPWGRAFTRDELTALCDVVEAHGARVISDEIHAPLVLPGATHVPYAAVAAPGSGAITLVSATKGWTMPGLKCAQVVCGSSADAAALRSVPMVANHGVTTLGSIATRAAYLDGGPWLDAVVERLDANRALFIGLVAKHLPRTRMRPFEAGYLAWLDARDYGLESPGQTALSDGRVWVDHRPWGPGGAGHVRVNLATSPDRVEQVVARLARAWER